GATFAIGLIPGYSTIGVFAPILVFLLRAIQGLALGGEYGGAAIYVAEHAPNHRRGFFTSFIQITATLGLIVSLAVILLCKSTMSASDFAVWGWRIPFLLSSILVVISYFIRHRMEESPEFQALKSAGKTVANPLRESFSKWSNLKWVLLALFGATAGQGVVWYTGQFYAMNFCTQTLKIDSTQLQKILIAVLLIGTPLFILFGWLSDRVGRKWIILAGIGLGACCYYPTFHSMRSLADPHRFGAIQHIDETLQPDGSVVIKTTFAEGYFMEQHQTNQQLKLTQIRLNERDTWLLGGLLFTLLLWVTMAYGPIAAFLVELFPPQIRYTSLSLPYHIGNGVFGGLTPFIAESVVLSTGNALSGLYYPMIIASSTFVVGAFFLKTRSHP
ncbi:MAG: MFS transporter, partial [Flavobacteriales bacterium]